MELAVQDADGLEPGADVLDHGGGRMVRGALPTQPGNGARICLDADAVAGQGVDDRADAPPIVVFGNGRIERRVKAGPAPADGGFRVRT